MKINKILFAAVALSMVFLLGCGLFQTKKEKTAEELMNEGSKYFDDGSYAKAISSFNTLKDWYPFSKYASVAQLKIADAHFNIEEYDEAAAAYKQFKILHPRNKKTPYAAYQIGRCYFMEMDSVDRDQTSSKKALASYNQMIKNFPESPFTNQARVDRLQCIKSLSEKELYVGMFYFKAEHYKAALFRFKSVVSNFPDTGSVKTALKYIPLCEKQLNKKTDIPKIP